MQDQVTANSEDENSHEVKTPQQYSFQIAVVLSAIIIGFSVLIWIGVLHIPASPYEAQNSSINIGFNIADFGTYVSGIFTSLSFIWLVVNALQQREDLSLQRREMVKNNEHQKEQAKQLEESARINLANSKLQSESFATENIIPQLRTIYFFLQLKARAVQIHINPDLKDSELDQISQIFKDINRNYLIIDIISIKSRDELSIREFASAQNDDDLKIILFVSYTIDILISNTRKISKIKKSIPNAFISFKKSSTIDELKFLFSHLLRLFDWLEPGYAATMRKFYKLDEVMLSFEALEDIKF